jgi:hypothetical protein
VKVIHWFESQRGSVTSPERGGRAERDRRCCASCRPALPSAFQKSTMKRWLQDLWEECTAETLRTLRAVFFFLPLRGRQREPARVLRTRSVCGIPMEINALGSTILGSAVEVPKALEPGLPPNVTVPVMWNGIVRVVTELREQPFCFPPSLPRYIRSLCNRGQRKTKKV